MSRNNKSLRKTKYKRVVKPFPCKECLILPMCLNKFQQFQEQHTVYYQNVISKLADTCSLLKEYIEGERNNRKTKRKVSRQHLHRSFDTMHRKETLVMDFFYAQNQKKRQSFLR